jgi:hypothetical protein
LGDLPASQLELAPSRAPASCFHGLSLDRARSRDKPGLRISCSKQKPGSITFGETRHGSTEKCS